MGVGLSPRILFYGLKVQILVQFVKSDKLLIITYFEKKITYFRKKYSLMYFFHK